jgi:hypothetical protein
MYEPGELEVALVVPGGSSGDLADSLHALYDVTRSEEQVVLERCLSQFGHGVHPKYFSEFTWREARSTPLWQYYD